MSSSPVEIRYAVTLFSGYLQKFGSSGSGLVGLEHDAYGLCVGRRDVRVRLYPWNTNVSDVAEALWRYRPKYGIERQTHVVVGYSYGGDRAAKFVRELQYRGGCTVQHLILCDAVRRWDWLPGLAGITGLGSIQVPRIVEHCTAYVQQNPRWQLGREGGLYQPAGHRILLEDDRATRLSGPIQMESGHSYIDNDLGFQQTVLDAVSHLISGAGEAQGEA